MRQTVKTAAHAPMKIQEPLLVGMLVMLLIAFNLAAGTRFTLPAAPTGLGLSLFQSSLEVPAPLQLFSIDD